jgi:hypothetical protein
LYAARNTLAYLPSPRRYVEFGISRSSISSDEGGSGGCQSGRVPLDDGGRFGEWCNGERGSSSNVFRSELDVEVEVWSVEWWRGSGGGGFERILDDLERESGDGAQDVEGLGAGGGIVGMCIGAGGVMDPIDERSKNEDVLVCSLELDDVEACTLSPTHPEPTSPAVPAKLLPDANNETCPASPGVTPSLDPASLSAATDNTVADGLLAAPPSTATGDAPSGFGGAISAFQLIENRSLRDVESERGFVLGVAIGMSLGLGGSGWNMDMISRCERGTRSRWMARRWGI